MKIRKLGLIGSTYRHAARYRHILAVLAKYGFGDLVERLHIERYVELGYQLISRERRETIESMNRAERFRHALEELGPTYMKVGQILSTRPDLISTELMLELEKLQENAPPFSFPEARAIIEAELERPLFEVFKGFDEDPIAAASIGQVHRAVLRRDRATVAVKVQRPGIQEMVEVDLEIMLHLAGLAERYLEPWEIHRPTEIVRRIAESLQSELDYSTEASHLERFAHQFEKDARVVVPRVYEEATRRRVLTMSFEEGIRVSDLDRVRLYGLDPKRLARRGGQLLMKQIFEHGFFHADPHPGNIFALPHDRVLFLDFGMMGSLDTGTRAIVADLIYAASCRDDVGVTSAVLRLTDHDPDPEVGALERDVATLLNRHLYRPVRDMRMGSLVHDVFALAGKHRIRIPSNLVFMIKALSTAESLARYLDPDFDMVAAAKPYLKRVHRNRYHPRRLIHEATRAGVDFLELLSELPDEIRVLLDRAKSGHVKIEFEHRRLEPMIDCLDRMGDILSFAIVQGSLVIGSSIMVLSDVPPHWKGIPLIGVIGFVVAGLMGFRYLLSLHRSAKI